MKINKQDFIGFIICLVFVIGLTFFCLGSSDPKGAERILKDSGYTQIEITGWRPFSKSKDDFYSTGFKAKSVNGAVVTGTVTKGLLFKGSTVHLD